MISIYAISSIQAVNANLKPTQCVIALVKHAWNGSFLNHLPSNVLIACKLHMASPKIDEWQRKIRGGVDILRDDSRISNSGGLSNQPNLWTKNIPNRSFESVTADQAREGILHLHMLLSTSSSSPS